MPTSARPIHESAPPEETNGLDVVSNIAVPVPVYDVATLTELEGVFGLVRLMDLLAHLKDEIAQRLLAPETDRVALRHDAHTLLSVSGSLGFFELSRRCVEMEQACLLGADVAEPLGAARAAAGSAIAAIGEIQARVAADVSSACAA